MSDDVKEVLAAIKKTKGMREKINKELGIKTATDVDVMEDIYDFSFKKPDAEEDSRGGYILLHGRCVQAGTAELKEWGYEFIRERHFDKKNGGSCFVKCEHCGERLDEKRAAKLEKEKAEKYRSDKADALEMQEIRREWEAEQILLGNL
jgi:hypothetical protein